MFQTGRLAATLNPKFQIMNNPNISFGSPGAISYDSPAARGPASLSADEADVAAFNSLMSDTPASTFESRFQKLTPEQKQQVKADLENFTVASDQALEAVANLGESPKLDTSRMGDSKYIESYGEEFENYQNKFASAIANTSGAVDAGLKFVDTMDGIDPELANTIPEFGTNLIALMQIVGKTPAEIQRVATAFGIQAP
jgi:hypothetical protein